MRKIIILTILIILLLLLLFLSQFFNLKKDEKKDEEIDNLIEEVTLHGYLIDSSLNEPVPNIPIKFYIFTDNQGKYNKTFFSNETGQFSINVTEINKKNKDRIVYSFRVYEKGKFSGSKRYNYRDRHFFNISVIFYNDIKGIILDKSNNKSIDHAFILIFSSYNNINFSDYYFNYANYHGIFNTSKNGTFCIKLRCRTYTLCFLSEAYKMITYEKFNLLRNKNHELNITLEKIPLNSSRNITVYGFLNFTSPPTSYNNKSQPKIPIMIFNEFGKLYDITVSEIDYNFEIILKEGTYYFIVFHFIEYQQQIQDEFHITNENNEIIIDFIVYHPI